MNNGEFKSKVGNCLMKNGFVYHNKKYFYNSKDIIVIIEFQKSNYSNLFYINFGFCIKLLHEKLYYPSIDECDVFGRFRNNYNIISNEFELDNLNEEVLCKSIGENLEKIIFPVIKFGIEEYFRLFPKAINVAKPKLREFLAT